jgi:hypothetical protein
MWFSLLRTLLMIKGMDSNCIKKIRQDLQDEQDLSRFPEETVKNTSTLRWKVKS